MNCMNCNAASFSPLVPPFGCSMCRNKHIQCVACNDSNKNYCSICQAPTTFIKMEICTGELQLDNKSSPNKQSSTGQCLKNELEERMPDKRKNADDLLEQHKKVNQSDKKTMTSSVDVKLIKTSNDNKFDDVSQVEKESASMSINETQTTRFQAELRQQIQKTERCVKQLKRLHKKIDLQENLNLQEFELLEKSKSFAEASTSLTQTSQRHATAKTPVTTTKERQSKTACLESHNAILPLLIVPNKKYCKNDVMNARHKAVFKVDENHENASILQFTHVDTASKKAYFQSKKQDYRLNYSKQDKSKQKATDIAAHDSVKAHGKERAVNDSLPLALMLAKPIEERCLETELIFSHIPIRCPDADCMLPVFVSLLNKHIIKNHPNLTVERIGTKEVKRFLINIHTAQYAVGKCQAAYFLKDRNLKIRSDKYSNLLPILIMCCKLNFIEVHGSINQTLKCHNEHDFCMIWLTGLVPLNATISAIITVRSLLEDCPETYLSQMCIFYSIQEPHDVKKILESGCAVLLNCAILKKNESKLLSMEITIN